jgi:hypothetical protein
MGAAASVTAVYADALKWFQMYIDRETYLADFSNLDKGHQGLTFMDFRKWVEENAEREPDSCWGVFLTSGTVLAVAHKAAAAHGDFSHSVDARHIVDVTSFRALLIHLYATSILWRHFAGVKSWHDEGTQQEDLSHFKLNFEDYCLGVKSFCNAHCKEVLTEEVMKDDFEVLSGGNDDVGFMQLCQHCVKYMDLKDFNDTASMVKAKHLMGVGKNVDLTDPTRDLKAVPKGVYADLSLEDRNDVAMNQINNKLVSEDKKVAQFMNDAKMAAHEQAALADAARAAPAEAAAARAEAAAARAEAAAARIEAAAARIEAQAAASPVN